MTEIEVWMRPMEDIERPTEETRWHRIGIWRDGEVVEGDIQVFDDQDAEEVVQSYSGRASIAVDADDRPEVLESRVEAGLIHADEVFEAIESPSAAR